MTGDTPPNFDALVSQTSGLTESSSVGRTVPETA